jgi:uncharacterized protein (TIGR03086 family)
MNDSEAFRRASGGFMERLGRVRAEQWSASTPCSEWDVRALVNHVGGEYMWVTELMAGRTVADVGDKFDGDVLGDDPVARVALAQEAAAAAFDEPDAASRTVQLSFGATPAMDYARQMAVDSVIHSWDLARAIGADESLDPELVDYAYAEMVKSADDWRAGGAFGPEREASDQSTQAKLLALTGR